MRDICKVFFLQTLKSNCVSTNVIEGDCSVFFVSLAVLATFNAYKS